MNKLTIVMYHYVRDQRKSAYPDIKALDVHNFEEQLKYIKKYYQVVTMEDLFATITGDSSLPDNSLLLTFDDGYKDHFQYVLPLLKRYEMQGSFFPPVRVITEGEILDVNKIHFILASGTTIEVLLKRTFQLISKYRSEHNLPDDNHFKTHSAEAHRYDSKETMLFKRMLQRDLPKIVRKEIIQALFQEYVAESESEFAATLYMSKNELISLRKEGMYLGAHGYHHSFLTHLTPQECDDEVDKSLAFLKSLGADTKQWAMCYPYGFYNDQVIDSLKKFNCTTALSIDVGIADLDVNNVYTLPRLDTNDLPQQGNAAPNKWTQQVLNL